MRFTAEARRTDATASQLAAAAYEDPTPSPAWLRPYYVCGCGFECAYTTEEAFGFRRIPHPCSISEKHGAQWRP